MKTKIIAVLLMVLLAVTSCTKDELTLPSDVSFEFGLVPYSVEDDAKGMVNQFSLNTKGFDISKGLLVIESIQFDGRRDEGKDVFFTSNFSNAIVADLENRSSNYKVKFDIPQGVYNKIDISLQFGVGTQPPLILEGIVNAGLPSPVTIRFEYNYPDMITVRANPSTGQNIVLRKDKASKAIVLIDANFMFRFINSVIFANADIVNINGEDVLLVNNKHNINIFNQLANRISNSIVVVFE